MMLQIKDRPRVPTVASMRALFDVDTTENPNFNLAYLAVEKEHQ